MLTSNRSKQYFFGAILSYAAIAFNIIAGLLYIPWMIRIIGDDQYALFTLAMSVINLFLIDLGIGASVTKFLSNYYAGKQYKEADKFLGIVYKVFFCITAVIAICFFVFYILIDGIYQKLTLTEIATFKDLFIIIAVYSVFSFPFTTFDGILMANEKYIELKMCNFGQKLVSTALIIVFLSLGGQVYTLVLVNVISNLLFIFVKYIIIKQKTAVKIDISEKSIVLIRQLLSFSIWITVMSIAGRLIFNVMPTMISAIVGSVSVTIFSLASSLEGYVYSFSEAINGMFLPKISRILVEYDSANKIAELAGRIGKLHVYTLGPIFIGFVCFGRQFVLLWMGEGYDLVYICAVLLIFPSMIDVPLQVARVSLLVMDIVKEQAFVQIGMAFINIVLSLILLSTVGVVGAAIAVCISYLVRTLGMLILYKRHLQISLKQYFKTSYGRWIPIALLMLAFGYVLNTFSIMSDWGDLGIKIFIICIVYAMLAIFIGLTRQERTSVVKFLRSLKKHEVKEHVTF